MGRPKHALKCLAFSPFMFWGVWGRFFSYFSAVCTMFLQVPNGFSICSPISQCFPQNVIHTTSLLSHMPWKMVSSFQLYRCAKGEELCISKQSLLFQPRPKMVTNREYKRNCTGFNLRTRAKWPTQGQNFQQYSNTKPKHDLAQLYGLGFNTRPKFI